MKTRHFAHGALPPIPSPLRWTSNQHSAGHRKGLLCPHFSLLQRLPAGALRQAHSSQACRSPVCRSPSADDADTCPRHMHRHSIATERLRMATPWNASSIWNEDSIWITKDWVDAKPQVMPGFLASRGEEFNPGPVTKLDRSGLLCHKVLLKYKRDRESCWHRLSPASL